MDLISQISFYDPPKRLTIPSIIGAVGTTFDPTKKTSGITLSNGNNTATNNTAGVYNSVLSVLGPTTGKRYFEVRINTFVPASANIVVGFSDNLVDATPYLGAASNGGSMGYFYNGSFLYKNSAQDTGITYAAGDVIGFAVDATAGAFTVYKNNVQGGTSGNTNPSYTSPVNPAYAAISFIDVTVPTVSVTLQTGPSLTYTPPTGYTSY